MRARSKKNKGLRYEHYLTEFFREHLDIGTHETPASGGGLDKGDIRIPSFNIEVEAKNAARLETLAWWEQTKSQRTQGNVSILAMRHPKKPEFEETILLIDLNDFVTLLNEKTVTRTIEKPIENKSLAWSIASLKASCQKVLKEIEQ